MPKNSKKKEVEMPDLVEKDSPKEEKPAKSKKAEKAEVEETEVEVEESAAEEVPKLSESEKKRKAIQEERVALKEQEKQLQIDENKAIVEGITCKNCGAVVGVNPDIHFAQPEVTATYTCPECKYMEIVRTSIDFNNPKSGIEVNVRGLGFEWDNKAVGIQTKEELAELIKRENRNIVEGNSPLPKILQVVIRHYGLNSGIVEE